MEKANKFIAAVDSVQGPGEAAHQFNLDDPSQRTIDQPPPTPASGADTTSATAADTGTDANKAAGATPSTKPADAGTAESKNSPQWPGSAEAEIERIKAAPNHYATLHVSTDADNSQMKKNYYALARMLHPDKCQLEGADNAMTSVSQAYDTLTNVLKKTLYDQFLSQTGDDAEHPNQTYQEWESRQQPVEMPKWLNVLLGIKGCGWILAILVMLVLTPILLLLILVYIIFAILCLPFRLFIRICFPERYAEMKKQHERELAKMEEQTQDRIFAHV